MHHHLRDLDFKFQLKLVKPFGCIKRWYINFSCLNLTSFLTSRLYESNASSISVFFTFRRSYGWGPTWTWVAQRHTMQSQNMWFNTFMWRHYQSASEVRFIPNYVSWSMVTTASHIFINIFQLVNFSAVKFTRSYILWEKFQNLRRFEQNLNKIGLGFSSGTDAWYSYYGANKYTQITVKVQNFSWFPFCIGEWRVEHNYLYSSSYTCCFKVVWASVSPV